MLHNSDGSKFVKVAYTQTQVNGTVELIPMAHSKAVSSTSI